MEVIGPKGLDMVKAGMTGDTQVEPFNCPCICSSDSASSADVFGQVQKACYCSCDYGADNRAANFTSAYQKIPTSAEPVGGTIAV